jgi:hypothetical protein
MAMAAPRRFSILEYLQAERKAETKSECVNGEIFAMAGTKKRRSQRLTSGRAARCRMARLRITDLPTTLRISSKQRRNLWPFDQGPRVACITTRWVLDDGLPILRVTHYSDDHSWAFVCGTPVTVEDGRIISMQSALRLDPTLRTIADLPPGWIAWREDVGAPWNRYSDDEM